MRSNDPLADSNRVLNAIQLKDANGLIALFSVNTIQQVDTLDNSMEELFQYFDGDIVSYDDWGGPIVDTTKEYGQVLRIAESTFDVKTTEEEYRITI